MDLLHKWCIKNTIKSRCHHSAIWILFIAILLMVDIGVSKDGSVIHFHAKELNQAGMDFNHGDFSYEKYTKYIGVPQAKMSNVKNNLLLNVTDNNERTFYQLLQDNECMFYLNFTKYNVVTVASAVIVIFICMIISFLEKILLFIQSNDGKKEKHSKLQLNFIL